VLSNTTAAAIPILIVLIAFLICLRCLSPPAGKLALLPCSGTEGVVQRSFNNAAFEWPKSDCKCARGHLEVVGTPAQVVDTMQLWVEEDAADGFNVILPYFPGGLNDFVDGVIPELQRRGIFRTEYQSKTLRGNLGLPVPENRQARIRELEAAS
jgi:hypothetical protein